MYRRVLQTLTLVGVTLSSLEAATIVEDALLQQTNYTILGTFAPYDFEPKGDNSPFDWAFTMLSNGKSYQLQGVAPTPQSVFGWKEVDIIAPAPQWYMFQLDGDIDGDGSKKFDWILSAANPSTPASYKLEGVSDSGTFQYSDKLNIDYRVEGRTITTGAVGSFTATNPINETDNTSSSCITLPQETLGQTKTYRNIYYVGSGSNTVVTMEETITAVSATSTSYKRDNTINSTMGTTTQTERGTTYYTITNNYKDITKTITSVTSTNALVGTLTSDIVITYTPSWRTPANQVCQNQQWVSNATVTTSSTTQNIVTSDTFTQHYNYQILSLNERKSVMAGTFTTIKVKKEENNGISYEWIDTATGVIVAHESYKSDGSLEANGELLQLQ